AEVQPRRPDPHPHLTQPQRPERWTFDQCQVLKRATISVSTQMPGSASWRGQRPLARALEPGCQHGASSHHQLTVAAIDRSGDAVKVEFGTVYVEQYELAGVL